MRNRPSPDIKTWNSGLQSVCEIVHKSSGFSLHLGTR